MWYQLLTIALLAQLALGAIHKPSKIAHNNPKHHQNGSKFENGRGPYYYHSGQDSGLGRKPAGRHKETSSLATLLKAEEMITEYRFEGTTTSGVTTGCVITVQPDKRKQTSFFVIDTTGEEHVVIKGSTVRMTFPGPSFFPGLTRTNTVYFHEMCFPSQCGSGSCGFVTGPVTSTRSSVDRHPCPPPVTPPPNPVPCENGTSSVSGGDPSNQSPSTPPDSTGPTDPIVDPADPSGEADSGVDTPEEPISDPSSTPTKSATVNTTNSLSAKPTEKRPANLTPDPCPDDPATPVKEPCPDDPIPSPTPSPIPTPPRSRPSSSTSAINKVSPKPVPYSKPSTTADEDILAQLQKLISMTNNRPERVPVVDQEPVTGKTSAEETEEYYSGLPGAVRGHTGAIYYPSCSATAYRQVAITPFCDTRRMRNRQKNVFAEAVPNEDLQLFAL